VRAPGRTNPRAPKGVRGIGKPTVPGRKWLFRLIALVIIPLIILGGIEGALRLAGYGHDTDFFKKITIGTREFFVNNDAFGLRFFPPQLVRWPSPLKLPVQKPAGTCRIFILGESAAMGDPEPAYGASRYLEALLGARFPQTHFEIINTGITAINSHVILPIARECARHEGDLWIIYMGNNEMVGPFGAATVFGAKAPPLPAIRLNLAIQETRLGQWLVAAGRKLKGDGAKNPSWGGMEMFTGNQLPADDPRKEVVYQNFSRNLQAIVQAGLGSGAKILLNTMAVNLRDCAPFGSLTNVNLTAAERAQFGGLYAAGCAAETQGDFGAAARKFAAAARLDPQCADVQYHWGRSLLALTNAAAAREHFQLACDDDALPFRTDSRINALIAATGRQWAGEKLVLFDAAGALSANSPAGLCGDETFYEHVHFNFDGSYQLGLAWAEQVARMLPALITPDAGTNGWASRDSCDQRLGLSDWNRSQVFQRVIGRMQLPPLSHQLDNAGRMKKLADQVDELRPRMNPTAAAKVREDFQQALLGAPDDVLLRENIALFLQSIGDLPGAVAEWRQVHDRLPQDYTAYFELGRLLVMLGQGAEAEAMLRHAVELRPNEPEGWFELGNLHTAQQKLTLALDDCRQVRRLAPKDPQTACWTGKVLAQLNRHAEAVQLYREAIRLSPGSWEAHYELAGELDSSGALSEAEKEFAKVAQLLPGNPQSHFNHGVLLAKLNRLEEAQREFEETLRLEPGYVKAQKYLTQLQPMRSRAR